MFKDRHKQEECVTEGASFFPGINFGRVSFGVVVIYTVVQPVSIIVNVKLFVVLKFIQRVVLQIVDHNEVICLRCGFIFVVCCIRPKNIMINLLLSGF